MGIAHVKFCNNEDVSKTLKDERGGEVPGEVLATDLSRDRESSELADGIQGVEEANTTTTPPSDDKAFVEPRIANQESDRANQTGEKQTEEEKTSGEKRSLELANAMQGFEEASTATPPSNDKAVVEPKSLGLAAQETDRADQTGEVKNSKDEVQAIPHSKVAPKKKAVPLVRFNVCCGAKGKVLEDSDDDRTNREKHDSSKVQEQAQAPQTPFEKSKEDEKNAPCVSEGIKIDETSK